MCTYSSKMKKRNLKLNLNNVLRHLWNFKNTTPPPTFVRSCVSLACLCRVLISMLFCSFDIGWDSSSSIYGTFFWWTFCLSWKGVVGLRAGGITSAARQWPNSENRIINSATRHHPHVIAVVLSLPALATLWTDEEYLPPSLQHWTWKEELVLRFTLFLSRSVLHNLPSLIMNLTPPPAVHMRLVLNFPEVIRQMWVHRGGGK